MGPFMLNIGQYRSMPCAISLEMCLEVIDGSPSFLEIYVKVKPCGFALCKSFLSQDGLGLVSNSKLYQMHLKLESDHCVDNGKLP